MWLLVGAFVGLALLGAITGGPGTGKLPGATEKPTPSGFSAWDGSNSGVVKATKSVLNDPASFEHVKTTFWTFPDHQIVIMQYRAKNAFGAMTLASVKARCDTQGGFVNFEN